MTGVFLKDPGGRLEYQVDWQSDYLAGRSIMASDWQVLPDQAGVAAALTLSAPRLADGRTAITLGGGRAGQLYRVVNRITLADGNSDERTLLVRVEDR
ncbi:hypothetical protein CHU93_10435 [Sandarakinorhabdus cyanobacteriorum]|uniref:Phage tail protein n=1 Tax=Sandarakinorhabdus cyanobacteriorum TaxID=1981098 RepID=A0A255YES3_9SPHN|nr:hypothetical protein [Sandarakinorhabdus cyanobacteriorum]OYQ27673.1 hypothetical protein CHU93_10435 [Sandarakinorhabdus cyanobacteriorum]